MHDIHSKLLAIVMESRLSKSQLGLLEKHAIEYFEKIYEHVYNDYCRQSSEAWKQAVGDAQEEQLYYKVKPIINTPGYEPSAISGLRNNEWHILYNNFNGMYHLRTLIEIIAKSSGANQNALYKGIQGPVGLIDYGCGSSLTGMAYGVYKRFVENINEEELSMHYIGLDIHSDSIEYARQNDYGVKSKIFASSQYQLITSESSAQDIDRLMDEVSSKEIKTIIVNLSYVFTHIYIRSVASLLRLIKACADTDVNVLIVVQDSNEIDVISGNPMGFKTDCSRLFWERLKNISPHNADMPTEAYISVMMSTTSRYWHKAQRQDRKLKWNYRLARIYPIK